MIHPDIYVQPTHVGLGLFAKRAFKRGEILWIIDDLDLKIPLSIYKSLDENQRHKLDIYSYLDFKHRVIVAWDEGKYVNHSCSPNSTALVQFDNISIAIRDIQQGEEIVEDYRCYFAHFDTFPCQCGAENCIGQVSANASYRADLRLDIAEIGHSIKSIEQFLLRVPTVENSELISLLSTFDTVNVI
jgi:SET domain-containing protein